MGFSRQEYWSGMPSPSPGTCPNPGTEPRSPALQADSLPSEPLGKPRICLQSRKHRRCRFNPWVGTIPWRKTWQPTPVFLPGESHVQRSLASYSPWGCKDSDRAKHFTYFYCWATGEALSTHTHRRKPRDRQSLSVSEHRCLLIISAITAAISQHWGKTDCEKANTGRKQRKRCKTQGLYDIQPLYQLWNLSLDEAIYFYLLFKSL